MEAELANTEEPRVTTSLMSTLWAIGTGTWSGLALSG